MFDLEKHLLHQEKILSEYRRHWIIFLIPAVLIMIAIVLIFQTSTLALIGYGLAAFSLLLTLCIYLAYTKHLCVITNKRIYLRRGVIRRYSWEKFLNKIDAIEVHQGLLGRFLGYGTVALVANGGSKKAIKHIHNPIFFRNHLQALVDKQIHFPNADRSKL